MGDYYCFDNPGAMHSQLKKRFMGNSTTISINSNSTLSSEMTNAANAASEKFEYFFQLLYSVYSLPNIVLPMIGGILIFKYGYRLMFLVFGFFVLVGQFIFAMGCSTHADWLMLLGRIIFGLGGESLNTTQYAIIVQWFATNELAFAMGLSLSFARFGNVLNDVVSPRIATIADVCSAMWVGFAICSFSFICTILLVYIDWRQDILIQMREIVTSNNTISMIQERDNEKSFSALRNLPRIFFFLVAYCMLMYGGILPFNYIATSFLIKTWYPFLIN
jgi:MFS family permease